MKNTYVNRKTYSRIVKELTAIANANGFRVKIYYRPMNWNRYGGGVPSMGEVRGYFEYAARKAIVVTRYPGVGRARVLHILAHEVRHSMHYTQGLYAGYYAHAKITPKQLKKMQKHELPSLKTAHAAELDADRWAEEYLLGNGIRISFPRYESSRTPVAGLHRRWRDLQP